MKHIFLLIITLTTTTLVGCSLTGSFSCSGSTATGKVSCTGSIGNELNSFSNIGIFDLEVQQSFDPSTYNIELIGSDIIQNQVQLTALDTGKNVLGSKYFSVNQQESRYYFTDPNAVKNWSYNFINMASTIEINIPINNNESNSSGSFILRNENSIMAATSWTNPPREGFPPRHIN